MQGARRYLRSISVGLVLSVTAAVLLAIGIGAWLFARRHRAELLQASRSAAQIQGDLILDALEHEMLANDRVLIQRMVDTFGRDSSIEQVLILDRLGKVQYASRPGARGTRLALDSPTCRVCHDRPAGQRTATAVIDVEGGTVLRSIVPVENRESCHRCHAPEQRINGLLVVDMATGKTAAATDTDLRWLVAGSGMVALGLLAAIALIARLVVGRRLRRFEAAAQAVTAGDLTRRVPADGNDLLSSLGREFNALAETATRLLAERRAVDARLAESHRMASLGMLASGFSHELNTPLASVLGCVEGILRRLERSSDEAKGERAAIGEAARIAREQLLRARAITQHFLRLSRGQDSGTDVVELGPLVAEVVRLIEPTARESGVALVVESPVPAVSVRAGDAQLQQVLLNLVLNAVQSCARGGEVRIAVTVDGRPRLSVRDDGCGIGVADRERIFEPFFGLRPGGTGLGLFLSLNMVRGWGGDITVASEVGKGSTFQVVFPSLDGGGATDG
jgi:signal transduction histidine kinase